MQSRTGNASGIFRQDVSAWQKHRMPCVSWAGHLGLAAPFGWRNVPAMLQTQTVAEAEKDTLGWLGYTLGLQWPLAIKYKVLSCYWKIHLSPSRIYVSYLITLISVWWAARTAHQKSGLSSVSPGKHYMVLQTEPNQQTIGLPVLNTAGMCCFFVQFLVLLTNVFFCLQSPMPPMEQNRENQCLSLGAQVHAVKWIRMMLNSWTTEN